MLLSISITASSKDTTSVKLRPKVGLVLSGGGAKGAGLSEGQAQRIAIARSLLRKGGLMLLDEPTSALDADTEEKLIKRLTSRLDGRTLIIVTHRDAMASLCDAVVKI